MAAAEAADLALDAALLVRALDARRRELRLEQVVRAQRDEPVGLDPPAALQHLLDRRASGCRSGSRANTPPNHSNAWTCPSRNACWVSTSDAWQNAAPEKHARITNRCTVDRLAREIDLGLAPVDLGLRARRVDLRHEHLPDRPAQRALARAHVSTDRRSATSAPCSSTSRCQIRLAV